MKRHGLIIVLLISTLLMYSSCEEVRYATRQIDSFILIDSTFIDEKDNLKDSSRLDPDGTIIVKKYRRNGSLYSIIRYCDTTKSTICSDYQHFFENGNKKYVINYTKDGIFDGKLCTFYMNGKLKREEYYLKGEFKSGTCYDSLGNEIKYFPCFDGPYMNRSEFISLMKFRDNPNKVLYELITLNITLDKHGKIVKIAYDKNNSINEVQKIVKCLVQTRFKPFIFDGEALSYNFNYSVWVNLR